MVPRDFRKPLCITAGCVTLVVAVLWEIASIFSIGVFNCAWNFFSIDSGVTTWSMFYVTYFMGGCKSPGDATTIGFTFSPPSQAAENLQIWMWIYTLLTALWIPACVLLTVAAWSEVRGRAGAALYYPWLIITSIFIILDFCGTIYYLLNVSSTSTPEDYATFMGSTDWSTLTNAHSSTGIKTWLPSFYATLYFCRFLVFWLLNVYFVYCVYKASAAVSMYKNQYLQSSAMTTEKRKTWRDKFFQGPDPRDFRHQQGQVFVLPQHLNGSQEAQPEMRERSPAVVSKERPILKMPSLPTAPSEPPTEQSLPARYKFDEFGIPIEELHSPEPREIANIKYEEQLPTSSFQPSSRVYDYSGKPLARAESYNERWPDSAPPIASGVEVPPELNRNQPFSYMAGDQPQLLKRIVSRSNSKAEYPVIPRPDYTIADRRSTASLEYVPNRFKLPSASSLSYDQHIPSSPTRAIAAPKRSQVYPRSVRPQSWDEMPSVPHAKVQHSASRP